MTPLMQESSYVDANAKDKMARLRATAVALGIKADEANEMKIAILIARVLLGLMFFVFGLNHILHFLHIPMPSGDAGLYIGVLAGHGVMSFVGVLMVIAGLLLLVGRYVPLALTILGPLIVNILLYSVLIAHGGAAPGLIALALEIFLIWAYRSSFRGLFAAEPEVVQL